MEAIRGREVKQKATRSKKAVRTRGQAGASGRREERERDEKGQEAGGGPAVTLTDGITQSHNPVTVLEHTRR